jgi:hypothetical protein
MPIRAVYAGSLDGSAPIYKEIQVNNNQTINEGDIVVLANGKASIAAAGAAAGTVLGVANTPIQTGASASATDVIKYDANPHSLYRLSYTGSAAPAIGNKYELGAAAYQFNTDDTTDGFIQVVEKIDTEDKTAVVLLTNRVFTGN